MADRSESHILLLVTVSSRSFAIHLSNGVMVCVLYAIPTSTDRQEA